MAERVAFTSLACLMYGYINTPTGDSAGMDASAGEGSGDICRVNLVALVLLAGKWRNGKLSHRHQTGVG